MNTPHKKSRRRFLQTSAVIGAGYWFGTSNVARAAGPNEKLNVACIGVGGRGAANVGGVSRENIVAMCDVDEQKAGKKFQQFDKAKRFQDYRVMLDKLEKQIDAVVISTPDHTHFHAARQAMLMGKHVYCEKPLAHSAWECRELTNIAKRMDVATQLGNQRHANAGMARTVEAVRAGVVGDIKEVYCFIGGSRGMPAVPKEFPAVPSHLNWDLWLGPAKVRPYSPEYCPYKWRFWWDFGTGETGNWGCHILDIPFWALKLKYPNRIDLDHVPKETEIDPQRTPKSMKTRLQFPAEQGRRAVTLHWWHGSNREVFQKYGGEGNGNTLFVGEKGLIVADFNGYKAKLNDGTTPEKPAETIAKSAGFYNEWIGACKGGPRSSCDFVDYSGPLAEAVLLANTAFRAGGGFDWNAKELKASGNANVDQYLFPDFRDGWKVD
ncbi:MAG TPA: Gfo/Idh/MocA family oxidoreductase [Planctomycetaceae bacterium]|nr:Gfo/Idh/MocA family oxidoreductase [Planctomycetaceae bacterium]